MTKGQLERELSGLLPLQPKEELEQYTTPSAIAATILWDAHMHGLLQGAAVLDLGCGNGILGLGASRLGARRVDMVEIDPDAAEVARRNVKDWRAGGRAGPVKVRCSDGLVHALRYDLVLMNPPFGTRNKGADVALLQKAFSLALRVYTFHKTSTLAHLRKVATTAGFSVLRHWNFQFPLQATFSHHRRRLHRIEATALYLECEK